MTIELPMTRRRILLAYTLTQLYGIQQAMIRLSDRGDPDAREQALSMQSWLNSSAMEWASEMGGAEFIHALYGPGHWAELVDSARVYLTMHQRELDRLLKGVSDDNSGNGS